MCPLPARRASRGCSARRSLEGRASDGRSTCRSVMGCSSRGRRACQAPVGRSSRGRSAIEEARSPCRLPAVRSSQGRSAVRGARRSWVARLSSLRSPSGRSCHGRDALRRGRRSCLARLSPVRFPAGRSCQGQSAFRVAVERSSRGKRADLLSPCRQRRRLRRVLRHRSSDRMANRDGGERGSRVGAEQRRADRTILRGHACRGRGLGSPLARSRHPARRAQLQGCDRALPGGVVRASRRRGAAPRPRRGPERGSLVASRRGRTARRRRGIDPRATSRPSRGCVRGWSGSSPAPRGSSRT